MALNLKSSLEIVKRAGFGPDDRMKSSKTERRMADSQRVFEQEAQPAREKDPLDQAFEQAELHRNPENLTWNQLLDIDDL